jgi:hypothetical protein
MLTTTFSLLITLNICRIVRQREDDDYQTKHDISQILSRFIHTYESNESPSVRLDYYMNLFYMYVILYCHTILCSQFYEIIQFFRLYFIEFSRNGFQLETLCLPANWRMGYVFVLPHL